MAQITPDQYIARVLANVVQTGQGSGVAGALKVLLPALKRWGHVYLNVITASGSFAKGTAIAGTTDFDLFISIKHDAPFSLQALGTVPAIDYDVYGRLLG